MERQFSAGVRNMHSGAKNSTYFIGTKTCFSFLWQHDKLLQNDGLKAATIKKDTSKIVEQVVLALVLPQKH